MTNRLALILLPLLVLVGCAAGTGDDQTPSPEPSATATPSETDASLPEATPGQSPGPATETPEPVGQLLTGTLGADAIEGGCPYLETDDGTRYEVIYPPGWTADRGNGSLRDPTGTIVARAGDTITVRGDLARDMASICQIGPIFSATEVVSAN